jgi:hypothetical protein
MILDQATAHLAGPAAQLLRRLAAGPFLRNVSDEIREEARDVVSRPKLRAKNPRVTENLSGRPATQAITMAQALREGAKNSAGLLSHAPWGRPEQPMHSGWQPAFHRSQGVDKTA